MWLTHVCAPQSTVRDTVDYYQRTEGNAVAWGKAVSIADVSAARVLADRFCLRCHEHQTEHFEKEGADSLYRAVYYPNSRSMLLVNLVRLPSPVSNRVFATWFTWRKEPDGSFVMAFAPMDGFADQLEDGEHAFANFVAKQEERRKREGETVEAYRKDAEDLKLMMQQRAAKTEYVKELIDLIQQHPLASKAIRGMARGYWHMKPLAPSVCQVTYTIQGELGGSIPSAIINAGLKGNLGRVQTIQVKFARNGKLVDKEMRDVFASPPPLAELSEEQMSVVEDCRYLESEDGREWETLTSPSPFVAMWVKHAPANTGSRDEHTIAIGKATALIDCTALEAAGESSEASTSTRIAFERLTKRRAPGTSGAALRSSKRRLQLALHPLVY